MKKKTKKLPPRFQRSLRFLLEKQKAGIEVGRTTNFRLNKNFLVESFVNELSFDGLLRSHFRNWSCFSFRRKAEYCKNSVLLSMVFWRRSHDSAYNEIIVKSCEADFVTN